MISFGRRLGQEACHDFLAAGPARRRVMILFWPARPPRGRVMIFFAPRARKTWRAMKFGRAERIMTRPNKSFMTP